MTFPLDNIFPPTLTGNGPHAYGRMPSIVGACLHTAEMADFSMASAVSCAKMQSPGGSLYAGGGSYHWLLTEDGPLLTVPYLEAAGGITLKRTNPPWAPGRYPFLKALLPQDAYDDPNNHLLQITPVGKTAQLPTHPKAERMVDDAAKILLWAEAQPEIADDLVVMGHMHWQTDRSDPGQWFLDMVMARYAALKAGNPPTIPTPGDDMIQTVSTVFPAGTTLSFTPQPADKPYRLLKWDVAGNKFVATSFNPPRGTSAASTGTVSTNGGPPMLFVTNGYYAGRLVDPAGPQPAVNQPVIPNCDAETAAAVAPYQRRITEMKDLMGKPLA